MPLPRLAPLLAALCLAAAVPGTALAAAPSGPHAAAAKVARAAGPALAIGPVAPGGFPGGPVGAGELARYEAIGREEGLPVVSIERLGARRLAIVSHGVLGREAFVKRASLLAYVIFGRSSSRFEALEFHNHADGLEQIAVIRFVDYGLYLHDHIDKPEYERRLAYHTEAEAWDHGQHQPLASRSRIQRLPALKPLVTLEPRPTPGAAQAAGPGGDATALASAPMASAVIASLPAPSSSMFGLGLPGMPSLRPLTSLPVPPLAAGLAPLAGFGYGLGLLGGPYDVYQAEYAYPLLPRLDLRPSLQIISPFSPLNYLAGPARATQGLSVACDLMGTGRQSPGPAGFSFDGGLGARVAMLQGAGQTNLYPALHLKLAARWQLWELAMRYPLLHAANDPTAGWETSLGLAWSLGGP